MNNLIGKQVIVRANRAGVFFGTLNSFDAINKIAVLDKCRKIYYWSGATETLQIAAEGVKNPEKCKITLAVDNIGIMDVIELIPCTEIAITNLNNVPVWKL